MRETHTGVVVLLGDKAYKAKKPIATDFLDFTTATQREAACAHEVTLNSRLAPDSYLGVAHFAGPGGGPAEPVVVMRRYADSTRLASLVQEWSPGPRSPGRHRGKVGALPRRDAEKRRDRQLTEQPTQSQRDGGRIWSNCNGMRTP